MPSRSRPQLFSNALPPTVACSALRAIELLREQPELVARLHENARFFRERLREIGFDPLARRGRDPDHRRPDGVRHRAQPAVLERGVFVTGFGYPVVPEGTARVRVQMPAAHERGHLERALDAFETVGRDDGLLAVA